MIAGAGLIALFRHRASLGGIGVLGVYLQDQIRFGERQLLDAAAPAFLGVTAARSEQQPARAQQAGDGERNAGERCVRGQGVGMHDERGGPAVLGQSGRQLRSVIERTRSAAANRRHHRHHCRRESSHPANDSPERDTAPTLENRGCITS
jgi:hypothetical protein